ncbi:MAG TPA: OmpA family protein [Novosphingobium sp.]|jgi:outer membrane protein OmpA-like peptidoglycan-associated protein|nr:OmpA family protein [Novosphingobium sp.]HQN53991.1 OmpA family protein [Novosphingobium sp.]
MAPMRNRLALVTLAAGLLAACQTVPARAAFSEQQVAALAQQGFRPVGENYELGIADKVLFGFDRSDLSPETGAVVGKIAAALTSVGIHGATVEGHTDALGADDYNLDLSRRRAEAVKAALATAGLPADAIRAQGLGETDPIETNDTEEGRAQNRRVVIVVTPGDAIRVKR